MDDQYQVFQDETAAPEEGLDDELSNGDDLVSTESLADEEDKEDSFDDSDE